MRILGIDTGPTQSAGILWETGMRYPLVDMLQEQNSKFLQVVRQYKSDCVVDVCCIEDVAFYGKILNQETFETLRMIGRLQEIFGDTHVLVTFPEVAEHFCGSRNKVKTSNINAVLVDRFGKKGTLKNPGILYGIKEHMWSALAVAVYYADTNDAIQARNHVGK